MARLDDAAKAKKPAQTPHDAALAVALHRFAERRRMRGERMTLLVAESIAALARRLGIKPTLAPAELGLAADFTLSDDDLWRAFAKARGDDLRRLDAALSGLGVKHDKGSEPRLGVDDSGVFRISRLRRIPNRRARR